MKQQTYEAMDCAMKRLPTLIRRRNWTAASTGLWRKPSRRATPSRYSSRAGQDNEKLPGSAARDCTDSRREAERPKSIGENRTSDKVWAEMREIIMEMIG
jgi:hypothetical protein